MAKIDFPKKQEQRLIPKYLLEYAEELQENHPDPSAEWGSQGTTYTAGEGIVIEDDTISVDTEDVAMVSNLATIAFSGSYNDLSNTPDLSIYELKEDAFSGDYNDLTNKPTIPTKTSDLDNDSGFITGIDSTDVISALGYTPGTSNFDGDYNSLTNKPTIPTDTSDLTNGAGFITSSALNGYATESWVGSQGYLTSVSWNDVNNKPTFATVATSGDYDDLINKPVIPVVNYPVTDVQANGSSVLDGTVAKITVPTKVSDLNNDSGYITGINSTDVVNALGYTPGTSNFSGDYTDLTNKPDLSIYATSASLSAVAFSGDYDDLIDKPTLATVATTGAYNDLTGKPTIPDTTYMVTTNTNQDITGKKTFKTNPIDVVNTNKGIQLHSGTNNSTIAKLGFTLYNSVAGSSNNEVGFLESNTSNSTDGHSTLLGYYNTSTNTGYTDWDLGFAYYGYNTTKGNRTAYKLVIPNQYNLNAYGTKRYIPIDFTDGTNTVRSDATGIVNISTLLPTVPTKTSDLNNDSGFITGITSGMVTTALGYTPGTSNFSGSYTDLTNKPSIPTQTSDLTNDSGFIDNSVNNLTNYTLTSNLATVATSGSYNDLSNKPTIPSVSGTNDGTNWTSLTINSDTYAIPQGGGGGTGTKTTIFENSAGTSINKTTNITFTNSFPASTYDEIEITYSDYGNRKFKKTIDITNVTFLQYAGSVTACIDLPIDADCNIKGGYSSGTNGIYFDGPKHQIVQFNSTNASDPVISGLNWWGVFTGRAYTTSSTSHTLDYTRSDSSSIMIYKITGIKY